MNRELVVGILSFILAVCGSTVYWRDICRGSVRPHRISFGIWMILTGILAVNQLANGGGYSALFSGGLFVTLIVSFTLSLKRGVGGTSHVDIATLLCAAALFLVWAITRDTRTTTVIAVSIDAVASVPTIVKIYKRPHTENYFSWVMPMVSGAVSIAALEDFDWVLWIFPVYVIVANGLIIGIKYVRRHHVVTSTIVENGQKVQ